MHLYPAYGAYIDPNQITRLEIYEVGANGWAIIAHTKQTGSDGNPQRWQLTPGHPTEHQARQQLDTIAQQLDTGNNWPTTPTWPHTTPTPTTPPL